MEVWYSFGAEVKLMKNLIELYDQVHLMIFGVVRPILESIVANLY